LPFCHSLPFAEIFGANQTYLPYQATRVFDLADAVEYRRTKNIIDLFDGDAAFMGVFIYVPHLKRGARLFILLLIQ
jgi:hypothetical protein